MIDRGGFVRGIRVERDRIEDSSVYPFSIPALRNLEELTFHPKVTFLIGENGSGKSTLIEAIAVASGFNPEGGSPNFSFATRRSESELRKYIRIARNARRPRTGFFLRAESYFNVATEIERLDSEPSFGGRIIDSYGGRSLHEQSHGESFLALVTHRFGDRGLYILDEPEAALSPQRQLALLARMHQLVSGGSQFLIATHSPILMAYPESDIFQLGTDGISRVPYEETEHFTVTRDFLVNREKYLRHLLRDE
jgi:predicted ATPase